LLPITNFNLGILINSKKTLDCFDAFIAPRYGNGKVSAHPNRPWSFLQFSAQWSSRFWPNVYVICDPLPVYSVSFVTIFLTVLS